MNLKEEKTKAWEEYRKADFLNVGFMQRDFNAGFDAGVLVERERVKKYIERKFLEDTLIQYWKELFPNEGEG
jgi:hypothetical protein